MVSKDFKVAADLATTYVGSDLLNAGPGDLDILFDIDIGIKLQGLVPD